MTIGRIKSSPHPVQRSATFVSPGLRTGMAARAFVPSPRIFSPLLRASTTADQTRATHRDTKIIRRFLTRSAERIEFAFVLLFWAWTSLDLHYFETPFYGGLIKASLAPSGLMGKFAFWFVVLYLPTYYLVIKPVFLMMW